MDKTKTVQPTTSQWKHTLERVDYYKIRRFLIKDLMISKVEADHFVNKNIHFLYIQVYGIILSKKIYKNKISLNIHDGSRSITCLLDENFVENHKQILREIPDYCSTAKNNELAKSSMITLSSLKYLCKYLPSSDGFNPGDIVLIEGKLSEHNGKLYIFVGKINEKTMSDFIENLDFLTKFYYMS